MAPLCHGLDLVLQVQSCDHGPMARTLTARTLAPLLGSAWRRPATGSRSAALADTLRALVVDGRLLPGTRLPSTRDLATELEVSRGSVQRAFSRLDDAGYITARTGAGTVITLPAAARSDAAGRSRGARDSEGGRGSTRGASADPAPVDGGVVNLTVAALPAPDPLLAEAVERAARGLARHLPGLGYAAAGLPELREAVAARLTERGLATTAEEVLVTAGAQHALRLILDLLVGPGDRVLVDAPGYPRTLAAVRAARARPVPIALGARGWDADAWADAARVAAPRLAVVVPDYQHPTGLVMSAAAREAIATTCSRAGTILVADETCSELRLDGPALPAPLGTFGAAITIGSMSKAAWAGLRIGWIRANARTIRELTAVRTAVDMASPMLEQLVALEVYKNWDAVLTSRRALLRPRRTALFDALREHAPEWDVRRPTGGISAWARLPTPDATRLAAAAADHDILLSPGPAFSVDGTFEHHIRLPFTLAPETITATIATLARLAAELSGSAPAADAPLRPEALAV
jgi:DNA-binding transcriptional MocR family regulator